MDSATGHLPQIAASTKRIVRRALTIGENRVELLLVELQEERERLLLAILLALGVAAFGLLAGVALTVAIVVLLWDHSPVMAMFIMTGLYVGAAFLLYTRLASLKKDWQTLPATLEQLRKDRECLERNLN